jgi:oligo-1,6-glucosidase
MTVAEGAGSNARRCLQFVDPDRKELNMAYHFESVDIENTLVILKNTKLFFQI